MGFFTFLCGSGVLCSLLLIFGIAPALLLVGLFVLYLSLTIAGQDFFQFSMGRPFAGDELFVDVFCAVAAVASGLLIVARISAVAHAAGVACWIVFAQASFVQTDADVGWW
jgi:hypothetical protein